MWESEASATIPLERGILTASQSDDEARFANV